MRELCALQAGQLGAHPVLRRVGNGEEQCHRHVLADDGGGLEQAFGLGGQSVDARGQDGLHGGGDLQLLDGLGKSVGARLAHERARLDKGPHALLKKQGIGLRPRDQNPLERRERRISP
jgi:hypothetical protein